MMEPRGSSISFTNNAIPIQAGSNMAEVEKNFKHYVDEIFTKVGKIKKRVTEVEQFYTSTSSMQTKISSLLKVKEKEKHILSAKKQQLQQDASRREAAAAKRMQELMRQFATIFRQITRHKWAWLFMEPVDVKGLGLLDYYDVKLFVSFINFSLLINL